MSPLDAGIEPVLAALGLDKVGPFGVVMPGGNRVAVGEGAPAFTLVFHTGAALASTLVRGHLGLLEAFFDGAVDVQGSLRAALVAGMRAGFDTRVPAMNHVENRLLEWQQGNGDQVRAKANARSHYGLGEPFFRLWLDDPLKMYTCAYWREGVRSLEQAQRDKIDHVCRKLQLARGERFADIGCGFGGFLFRAFETTGAIGTGVNTTTEQVDWVRREIGARGLQRAITVVEADFRQVDAVYDKVVSIGVLEHAGRDQLREVVQAHASSLRPGGLGLMHFIGHVGLRQTEPFIRKYVFPGGWIPGLPDVLVEMERCGLEVLDVENLRRHYALTLDEWALRFEARWPEIQALDAQRFDERFRRIWSCYLLGCAEMFRAPDAQTHLFQVLFSRGEARGLPMTRDHVYVH
jgi:cyclopropane-fatty-acyl-phospholipid synthase